ncbi:MAG TPA: transporter, partial [Gemmatimonadaceae bacterium]
FLTDAIGGNVANVPLAATGGSETFRFQGGVPEKTSTSAGPIFGERAQTLGRGRVLTGLSYSSFHFESLRGVDLHDIQLTFTHENVNFPGCDSIYNGDCGKMGIPALENDIMQFQLSLNIDVHVTSFYVTYGVFDRLDVGVVVPLVSTNLQGQSSAQVIPFGGPTAEHFFAGTPENPVLTANRSTSGSSFGLGDVALRVKYNVHESPGTNVSLFGDARLPTGGQDDLLGSGWFAARAMAVISARFGSFAPHLNTGYLYRHTDRQNDAVLGTLGFDQLLGGHVTMAVDLVSQLQVGDSRLSLPGPVQYDAPFHRTISPTTIPNMRDDIFDGSFGIEFTTGPGLTLITNALFPLNKGGLRPGVSYTVGVEYTF